jgi:ATP-dependent helicase/nuclease subunit A
VREDEAVLTEEQELAVARRHGPLALSAGAGSGKTSVLVERFVRAVREDDVAPGQILAITFTERAAAELRERIRARLLELGERDAARSAEAAFVSTIHGFCARLLRAHPLSAGIAPGFAVIEEGQADRMRRLAFGEALAGFLEGEPAEAVDLVAAYSATSLQEIVLSAYSALRSQGESRPRLPLPAGNGRAERAASLIDDLMRRYDAAYLRRKRERSALDFDDLELCARDLLREHPTVLEAWRERFGMLMVDELQDVNPRQLELLELLDRDNLFTVGDELQSIYGFRHADVRLFAERFERLERDGAALRLTCNFRSRPAILEAVDRVFAERMGDAYTPLVAAREPAAPREPSTASAPSGGQLESRPPGSRPPGSRQTVVQEEPVVELLLTDRRGWEAQDEELAGLPAATPWRVAEARLIAARVAELVEGGGTRAGEVAILLRAATDMPLYEAALRERGLPAQAATGSFWGHRQVSDLLAYLRTLANPLDELALYSTLACPLVGLTSDGLLLLGTLAKERGCSTWEAIDRHSGEVRLALPEQEGERVCAFGRWLSTERRSVALRPLSELLRRALAAGDYDLRLLSLRQGERRMANVNKLIAMARRFEAQEGRDLRAFLDHVAHMSEAFASREADAAVGDGRLEAVQLMSIHAAKGLEFPVVCVADLGRAPRLAVPDLIVERDRRDEQKVGGGRGGRLGLRLRTLGEEPDPLPALDYAELRAELEEAQQAEEDRVLYVAMTRARERLLLSGAADLANWPAPDRQGGAPIAWLAPALVGNLHEPAAGETGSFARQVSPSLSVRCSLNRLSAAVPDRLGGEGAQHEERSAAAPDRVVGEGAQHEERFGEAPDRVVGVGARRGPERTQQRPERTHPPEELDGGWPTVRRLRTPEPATTLLGDSDATISYSALAELERCGYRYYLERVLRMPERHVPAGTADHNARARIRGTVVHALLERIDFSRPLAPSSSEVGRVARGLGTRLAGPERVAISELLEQALHSELAQRVARRRELRREHPFSISLGSSEPLLVGVVDLLVREPDGSLLIVDYKSDRVYPEEDLEQVVQLEYGLQRLVYALAALHSGAPRVQIAHWFLERPHEPVLADFDADEREATSEQLLERLRGLRERGYATAEVPHRGICLTCPGRAKLCSWGEEHTMREAPPTPRAPARAATLVV